MFRKKDKHATTDQRLRAEIDDIRLELDELIQDGLDYDRRVQEAA